MKKMKEVILNFLLNFLLHPLNAVALVLVILAAFYFVVILWKDPLAFDWSKAGFEFVLRQFHFPIVCLTGGVAVLTAQLAIQALRHSNLQSAAATWEITQSNFFAYVHDDHNFPLSALTDDPLLIDIGDLFNMESLFRVSYEAPVITLRHLFLTGKITDKLEPEINPKLTGQLDKIHDCYIGWRKKLEDKVDTWICDLVNLGVATRQLRLYLCLTTEKMKEWDKKQPEVLTDSGECGHKHLPPYESLSASDVITGISLEMLCIVHAINFSQELEAKTQNLYDVAKSIFTIHQNVNAVGNKEVKDRLGESIRNLYREPWKNWQLRDAIWNILKSRA